MLNLVWDTVLGIMLLRIMLSRGGYVEFGYSLRDYVFERLISYKTFRTKIRTETSSRKHVEQYVRFLPLTSKFYIAIACTIFGMVWSIISQLHEIVNVVVK